MGISSLHLVGHSYGALVTLEMAATRPDVVRSLHLIEPPLLDLLPQEPLVREMDRRIRWIVEHHAEIGDEAATEAFFSMIGGERMVERLRGKADWTRLCTYATRFARGELASSYPSSSLGRLAGTIPVGLYTGGRSHPALRLITAELANRIDDAHLVDVPEAGHAVQMAKEVFLDALFALAARRGSRLVGARLSGVPRCQRGIAGAEVMAEATRRRTRFRCRQCLLARRALPAGWRRRH